MSTRKLTTAQTAAFMAILTAGTKVLGFVREMVLAAFYGAGEVTDAYNMAQNIPNILLAGIVSAVAISYMPILSSKVNDSGRTEGDLYTSRLLNGLMCLICAAIVLGAVFAKPLVSIFAPGYEAEQAVLTAWYLRFAFFSVLFTAFIYIFEAYLQYNGVFFPQIVLGYVQSAAVIVFVVLSAKTDYHWLIFGVVLGFALRGLGCWVIAGRKGYRYTPDFHMGDAVKEAILLALPIFIGGSVAQINTFVDRMLASNLEKGSVSALTYGNEIINAIVMLTVTILVTILYPKLNQAFAAGDRAAIGSFTEKGINVLALLAVPLSMGAMVYAVPVIRLVYERGAFTAEDTAVTASAFFCYAIGLTFLAVNQLITKVFYSLHDTKTAVYCSVIAVVCNIVLNLILVRSMAHAGLALATSIAQIINALLLYFAFKGKYPDITLLHSKKKLAAIAGISAVAVGISYLCFRLLSDTIKCSQVVSLGGAVLTAGIIYLALLKTAKFEELSILKDLVKRG
ncbi:MAG: murein biosynthesis integral membrane protein MurJ [Firmicutes bacterium]|nr:murein biosynthesis integral membrane protein MurJ [Bacillota bacterium]